MTKRMHRLIAAAMSVLLLGIGGLSSPGSISISTAAGVSTGVTGSGTLLTIACPSVSVCYAGGNSGTILGTRDGGSSWQAQTWRAEFRPSVTTIDSIACPSSVACFAQVQAGCDELSGRVPLLHTSDGGNQWITGSIPGCGSYMACPVVTTCYAPISPAGPGLPAIVRTTDSGRSWQQRARLDPNRLIGQGLACPTASVCYAAFGDAIGRSLDGGKRWSMHRIEMGRCATPSGCSYVEAITCPGSRICYAGVLMHQNSGAVVGLLTTKDGFRSWKFHPLAGLHGITAVSCPTQRACYALGGLSTPQTGGWVTEGATGQVVVTTDAGASWHEQRITTPYPFNALACPSSSVCYTVGFLGRVMGTRDGGMSWHDLLPALFVSGTYGATQPRHTYSSRFTASGPWQVAVGKRPGPLWVNGRPLSSACNGTDAITVYVRNARNQVVAGPIAAPRRADRVKRATFGVTGELRLDVVSRCSGFSARIDGVQPTHA